MKTQAQSSFPPYFKYWGKAQANDDDAAQCHLLPYHCLDVAAVGQVYLERSPGLLRWLKVQLGVDDDAAVISWVVFWLGLHDLGKFSLSFQAQRADLIVKLQGTSPGAAMAGVRHDSLGMQLWTDEISLLAESEGWFGDSLDIEGGLIHWARAVTGHHGQPPLNNNKVGRMSLHFPQRDMAAAKQFSQSLRSLLLTPSAASIPDRCGALFEQISCELSWWISGLAILADWIGSNASIFIYHEQPTATLGEYWPQALDLARQALSESGVLASPRSSVLSFQAIFPDILQPSPLQTWAIDASLNDGPQIHLLEDVTGAGKTEAAFMLTHRLMSDCGADGFFIGLPTMATANAVYSRIAKVYSLLFSSECPSYMLAHGGRNLVEAFAESVIAPGRDEADASQLDESATQRCLSWLADHNKRSLLSPAGVGTVDQALLGVLQSKHQSLRLLGLARKVLIIDEVHACDSYMQSTLETLLKFHARAGGSAILLSATLTLRMKSALLRAFASGCGKAAPIPKSLQYPLASTWSSADPTAFIEAPLETRPDVRRSVRVLYESEKSAVTKGIAEALAAGQCVAWIRNTVADALEAQAEMASLWPAERITLFHARFALGDRLNIEEKVLGLFGRDSTPDQRRGQLLIATQVAEQSLDVDFDLVVSDLAPIDRLIQRAGRLCRHVRSVCGQRLHELGAKDERGVPLMWVLGPAWSDAPPADWFKTPFPRAARVYENHGELWLTARALCGGLLRMPDDARNLIETVFGDDSELPFYLQRSVNLAEGKAYSEASQAVENSVKLCKGYVRDGLDWDSDSIAPSRLGEDTIEVLLGQWDGDVLQPWCHRQTAHDWAYSTIKVARRMISEAIPPASAARQAALQSQLARMPSGGKWVVLLALDDVGGRFTAQALSATTNGSGKSQTWAYSSDVGLTLVQSPGAVAPGDTPH